MTKKVQILEWQPWCENGFSSGCGKDSGKEGENDIEIVKKSAGKGVWGQMSAAAEKENLKSQTQYISIIFFFLNSRLEEMQARFQTTWL